MKNLKISTAVSYDVDLQSEGESLLCSSFDVERNRVFFASSANFIYGVQLPSSQKGRSGRKAILSAHSKQIMLEPDDSIVAIDYLMEKEALLIGTLNGSLLLHVVDVKTTEVVGRVEGGVKNISSSPDGALLAVTAGLGQLLVMTHDWEVLYETELDQPLSDNGVTGDSHDSSYQKFEAPISWRGDGKYLATLGGPHDSSSLQKIRIWERESGTLHSSSESKKFMGASLDWMPSGAKLVAAYERKDDNKPPLIVFFEKNGLERNSFSIDEQVEVNMLKWNCTSDLLAASVTCDSYDAVKVWSFSNYRWYLKQEIRYSKLDKVKFIWDPTKPLQLICWARGGKVTSYNFLWVTAVTDTSIALVIENCNLLVTPFSLSLMPPPMSLFTLKFSSAVQDITYLSKGSKNHLAACLSDGSLCIVELPNIAAWEQFEDKKFTAEASFSELAIGTLMHLTWLDSHILLGVSCHSSGKTTLSRENGFDYQQSECCHDYSLVEIELVCSEDSVPDSVSSSGWHTRVSKRLSLEGTVTSIVRNPAKRCSAFVQMDEGSILEYSSNTGFLGGSIESHFHEFDSDNRFSSSCPWMKAVSVYDNGIVKPLVFGLDDNGRLHVGRRILCNNCSSFLFYSKTGIVAEGVVTHLLLSTKQDLLFIISVDDILHGSLDLKFERPNNVQNKREENKDYLNIWERGAKLIGVIHGDEAAVVLQTNRGNLECIYPRKLVLVSIINALVQRRFKDALLMVRRHRIDFNVIIDCCGWEAFIESAIDFVTQVNNLSHITEFVCSIKNADVMVNLYKNYISIGTLPRPRENSQFLGTQSKVTSVLQAIRKAVAEHIEETPARELCILTTLARSEPPALEEALKRIKGVRELELSGADERQRKLYPSTEESLKHLLWLTDSEAVYEAALGLYDLNLAAIVALNSQKDPKEFLPYLKGLESLQPVVMKYTIDLKLCRHERALKHIVSAGDDYHEDCMNLMKNNPELFPLGLQLFTNNVRRFQVMEAWGNHLQEKKLFEDAASTYLCCSSFQNALKAYRACGDWKGTLTVAGLLKLGKEEVLQLANELCEEFQALGKPAEAAKIALEYCADVARGIGYYIIAREWDEALRVGYMHGREDLVTDVKDAALECAGTLICEYRDGVEKVGKYLARYLAVRQRRLVLAAKLQAEDSLANDADYDTVSEASSNLSGMSAYTMRTVKESGASVSSTTASKARDMRRQRKKGGKIRAGSPGEELALVDHLKGMSLTAGAQRELKSLIIALLTMGKEEIARQLQQAAETFQLSQEAAVKLTEDTIDSSTIDETTQTLEHYWRKSREASQSRVRSWQSRVLALP